MAPRVKTSVASSITDPSVQQKLNSLQGVKTPKGQHAPVNKKVGDGTKKKRVASPQSQLVSTLKGLLNNPNYTASSEKVKLNMLKYLDRSLRNAPKAADGETGDKHVTKKNSQKRAAIAVVSNRIYRDLLAPAADSVPEVMDFHKQFVSVFGSFSTRAILGAGSKSE